MPPKYVFNHICVFDLPENEWVVYHKLSKKIPKTVECYGKSNCIAKGNTVDEAIASAAQKGVAPFDIQVIEVISND